ncbi:MAG: response regulator [Turicibacter sp.]|nr:response regulator [Turicibacter sp.]
MIVKNKDMRVLIVDDVSIMRTVLKEILIDHCGIQSENIIEAKDGESAITMYETYKSDIVFLDIAMPDMDGKVVIKKLLELYPEAIIIMCTGSSDKASVMECIRAGAKDYVRKPITVERLEKAFKNVLGDVVLKRLLQ